MSSPQTALLAEGIAGHSADGGVRDGDPGLSGVIGAKGEGVSQNVNHLASKHCSIDQVHGEVAAHLTPAPKDPSHSSPRADAGCSAIKARHGQHLPEGNQERPTVHLEHTPIGSGFDHDAVERRRVETHKCDSSPR